MERPWAHTQPVHTPPFSFPLYRPTSTPVFHWLPSRPQSNENLLPPPCTLFFFFSSCCSKPQILIFFVLGTGGDQVYCDFYRVSVVNNRCIIALADGCNWGKRPRRAAEVATKAVVNYLSTDEFFEDTWIVKSRLLEAFKLGIITDLPLRSRMRELAPSSATHPYSSIQVPSSPFFFDFCCKERTFFPFAHSWDQTPSYQSSSAEPISDLWFFFFELNTLWYNTMRVVRVWVLLTDAGCLLSITNMDL